jgi:superfamily II DNA or RNA helicase
MAINKLAGKEIAVAFWGGLGKDKDGRKLRDVYIEKARKYQVKVIVGNAKMVSTGINIPRASCLYDCSPSANAENAEQRYSRILTPWEDKPPPIIRFFLDQLTARKRCLSMEIYKVLIPKFRPIIQDKDFEALKSYLKSKPIQAQHFEL